MNDYSNFSLEQLLRHAQDREAWYWIGVAYLGRQEFNNAIPWLEKTMNDTGNEWSEKAMQNLGILHKGGFHPHSSKDAALALFEKSSRLILSRLYAGFLYFDGTETEHDIAKGKEYIEAAIEQLIKLKGNDKNLSQADCYDIGWVYYKENNGKAYSWFDKCIERCDTDYASDRNLIELAKRCIGVLQRDGIARIS